MAGATPGPGCRALFAHLSEYLDGELPAVECARIERHCRTCGRCRDVIGSLRRTIALCRESGARVKPPAAVRARALARVSKLMAGSAPPDHATARSGPKPPRDTRTGTPATRSSRLARKKR